MLRIGVGGSRRVLCGHPEGGGIGGVLRVYPRGRPERAGRRIRAHACACAPAELELDAVVGAVRKNGRGT